MNIGLFKRTIYYLTIILCIVLLIFPSANSILINKNYNNNLIIENQQLFNNQESTIKVIEIDGGFGLTATIINEGENDISNIIINVEVSGGLIINIPINQYEIPILLAGDSTTIHLDISGFGFGVFSQIPTIILMPESPQAFCEGKGINARLIGPIIIKIGDMFNISESFDGYTLFTPEYGTTTYLINNSGEIVHTWESNYIQGLAVYLLENGNILRADMPFINLDFASGGFTGQVEIFDWNGSQLWKFEYSTDEYCLHHDIEMLPNGNILMIAWEKKTINEAINAGRQPNLILDGEVWLDYIIEVKPIGLTDGEIVWEWHVWDHLIQDYDSSKNNFGVVEEHPELINFNFADGHADWNHINSIDYNEELDQILLCSRNQNEIWIIDHSTTTEEAASHSGGRYGKGGDLLYRWGNPQVYNRGDQNDQMFFGQHDATWIETGYPGEGNLLIFNNGFLRSGPDFSSVDEIEPPIDINGNYLIEPELAYGPVNVKWNYIAENPTDFYSRHISGAQRLPNGNTLICDGDSGKFFEVTYNKEIVWNYQVSQHIHNIIYYDVSKIRRYSPEYPGLQNLFK